MAPPKWLRPVLIVAVIAGVGLFAFSGFWTQNEETGQAKPTHAKAVDAEEHIQADQAGQDGSVLKTSNQGGLANTETVPKLVLKVGGFLEVLQKHTWYRAKIVSADDKSITVHYCGFDGVYDEKILKTDGSRLAPFKLDLKNQWGTNDPICLSL
eukprot:379447_1